MDLQWPLQTVGEMGRETIVRLGVMQTRNEDASEEEENLLVQKRYGNTLHHLPPGCIELDYCGLQSRARRRY
jgi:hypothetical protein